MLDTIAGQGSQLMSPISISIVIGLVVLSTVSGLSQQKTVDKWTQDTGRPPMINRSRRSWYRYLRNVEAEMPRSVRRRIALWRWVMNISVLLMLIVVLIDSADHRR